MKTHHTIVIVGGGNAGISVASQLLRKDAKLDIVNVDVPIKEICASLFVLESHLTWKIIKKAA